MAGREELVRDLDYTERLLEYEGYKLELRMKLLDEKRKLQSALADVDSTERQEEAEEID